MPTLIDSPARDKTLAKQTKFETRETPISASLGDRKIPGPNPVLQGSNATHSLWSVESLLLRQTRMMTTYVITKSVRRALVWNASPW